MIQFCAQTYIANVFVLMMMIFISWYVGFCSQQTVMFLLGSLFVIAKKELTYAYPKESSKQMLAL